MLGTSLSLVESRRPLSMAIEIRAQVDNVVSWIWVNYMWSLQLLRLLFLLKKLANLGHVSVGKQVCTCEASMRS